MPAHKIQSNCVFLTTVTNSILNDVFWTPKLSILRTVTINDVFNKFERDGAFTNFDYIAERRVGNHRGAPWFDGLIYETMRAASDFLATQYDVHLDNRLDGYIERIAAAQAVDPDGYINTYVGLMCSENRWGANGSDQLWTHEEYNAGCLVEAAVHHYLATGKVTLLAIALRFASYMCAHIGSAPKHNIVPSHSLAEEAFIKLYQLLRGKPSLSSIFPEVSDPQKYLDLVGFWINNRGNHSGRMSFTEYAQDHCLLVNQPEAVGHSVRGTLLYAGLAALAAEVKDFQYDETCKRLWEDVVERKMFITGGVGPIKEYEGFGYGYYLPNHGYIETCAAVGLAFWASQMNQTFGDAQYMDVYERVIYNTALAGVSLMGNKYTYENPLYNEGSVHRWEWHKCPCCPPMLLKLFAAMPRNIYAHNGHDIFVNLYIGSQSKFVFATGIVDVRLDTSYPWDGKVRITLDQNRICEYGLNLRIPAWCTNYRVSVNNKTQDCPENVNGYLLIRRLWQAGDAIDLEMQMPIQRIVGHPFAGAIREHVAIQRGPVVYCVEGVDNPLHKEPILSKNPRFEAQYRTEFLGGLVTITANDRNGEVFSAIPYYAWDNRPPLSAEQDWLAVWLRQDDWLQARQALDGDDRKLWAHVLYQPLPDDI